MLRRLIALVPRRERFVLVALMIAGALSEGLGLFTLVPMLALLGDSPAPAGMAVFAALPAGATPSLGMLLALFFTLVLARGLIAVALGHRQAAAQQDVVRLLGQRCFDALVNAEWRWLQRTHSADHRATLISNVGLAGGGLQLGMDMATGIVLAAGTLMVALLLSWQTTLTALSVGLIMVLALARVRRRALLFGEGVRVAQRDLHRTAQRSLSAIRPIKLFEAEAAEAGAFARALADARRAKLAHIRDGLWTNLLFQLSGALLLVLVVGLGVSVWGLTLAVLLPLVLAIARMVPLLTGLHQTWHSWLHVVPSIAQVQTLTEAGERNAEPLPAAHAAPLSLTSAIRLSGVSVRYPGRAAPALEDVSCTIAARRTTALIGVSGSGKSTLADLVMGLIEPDAGSIHIDDSLLSGAARRRWRASVAYVEQDPILFHASIRENLLWAKPDASAADLARVLTLAAADFALRLPDGLDTLVGDNGVLLSGGERQRLCLARALLRAPDLLILDEATSALDSESEAAIRRAVGQLKGQVTCILIGHRSALIDDADDIIELAAGRLVQVRSGLAVPI